MSEESTTPDLVELTRRVYDAANVGDFDAMMRLFDRDAVWDMPDEGIGTFEGAVAVRRFVEDWRGSYEEYEVETFEGYRQRPGGQNDSGGSAVRLLAP